MRKLTHFIGYVIIAGNLALIGLVAWWLIHPYNLPTVNEPIPIENPDNVIAIGDPILMTLKINKTRDMTASTSINNITCNDGNLVTMATTSKYIPVGAYTVNSSSYVLPPKVARGAVCTFNFINTYKLNPLRSQTITWSSEEFTVKR